MATLTDVDAARGDLLRNFISKMEAAGFGEGDRDIVNSAISQFLSYADRYGWRLESYLSGEDYEKQIKKGENE